MDEDDYLIFRSLNDCANIRAKTDKALESIIRILKIIDKRLNKLELEEFKKRLENDQRR